MRHESIKSELIEWLTGLEDDNDRWHDLNDEQKLGIERGLSDVDAERVTPHDVVKKKYNLF